MDHKISKNSVKEGFFETRKNTLKKVAKAKAMCAHGKLLGMDTFSWIDPQVDKLATVIQSFPFKVLWVGSQEQISLCMEHYPELADSIEAIIVYDQPAEESNNEIHKGLIKSVGSDGIMEALKLATSLKIKKRVFLITLNKAVAREQKLKLEQFISLFN